MDWTSCFSYAHQPFLKGFPTNLSKSGTSLKATRAGAHTRRRFSAGAAKPCPARPGSLWPPRLHFGFPPRFGGGNGGSSLPPPPPLPQFVWGPVWKSGSVPFEERRGDATFDQGAAEIFTSSISSLLFPGSTCGRQNLNPKPKKNEVLKCLPCEYPFRSQQRLSPNYKC